jgi:hypothetical protein
LLLTSQAPCNLGPEVFRQPQVIESLLEGFSSVLRLTAVSRHAFVRFEAVALSGLRVFFRGSFVWRHGKSLRSGGILCG